MDAYVGTSAEVVIPTAKDLGEEGATVQISKAVLQTIGKNATSIKTSKNGNKIQVSDADLANVFLPTLTYKVWI
ncbi:hypothetical protein D9Y95_RS13695 [Enterococcus hirae]